MGQVVLNARELVEQLWAEADARKAVEESVPSLRPAGSLQHGHILRHLNAKWKFDTAARSGSVGGRLRRRAKDRLGRTVVGFLEGYFEEERDFMAHLVRLQNELAERTDETAEDLRSVVTSLRAAVAMLSERDDRLHALVEARLAQVEATLADLQQAANAPA